MVEIISDGINESQKTNITDVSASRAWGTPYRNTSGKHMTVSVYVQEWTAGGITDILADANNPPTTVVGKMGVAPLDSQNIHLFEIEVNPGDYYKINQPGTSILYKVYEIVRG